MRTSSQRSLDRLVSEQVLRWQEQERRRNEARTRLCVALSRLPGAGAGELGLRVAEELGYGFFGIEIVDQIARASGVRRELVADVDERVHAGIEGWVADIFRRHAFDESQYLRELLRTLATLSERGHAVVLGRGSPHVLPEERTLRVLVVASRAARLERLAKARGLSAAEAERTLAREESERLAFLRHQFRVEPDDPSIYDLVVNTDSFGIEGASEVVLAAFRQRFPAAQRSQASA